MPFKIGGKTYQSRDQYLKATGKRSKPTTTTTSVKKRKPSTTTTSYAPLLTPEQMRQKSPPPRRKKSTTTTTTPKQGVGRGIGKRGSEGAKTHRQRLEDAKHF
jgi:hypothetical protein